MDETEEVVVPTAPLWVWLGLSAIAAASFWCQAIVTEERLVPALNVISEYYHIPDDIAGATLMAAGASSPELFSSIVSLFITHSSLGLGTIVGSEIFNQLIICAGAVFASKNGKLQLDRAIVTREVGFYALGIVLLYFALQDVRPLESDPDGPDHIFVSFWEAIMVFSGYILYVIVCAKMQSIVAWCTKAGAAMSAASKTMYGSTDERENIIKTDLAVKDMPFLLEKKALSNEPAANWKTVEYYEGANRPNFRSSSISFDSTEGGIGDFGNFDDEGLKEPPLGDDSEKQQVRISFVRKSSSTLQASLRKVAGAFGQGRLVELVRHSERPSELHSIYEIQMNEAEPRLSCFMWQRSVFYTKAYFGSHAWHLRWFTITAENITSVPDRQDPDEHIMKYPRFKKVEVDEHRLIIKIINPNPKKRDYTIMAPSKVIFDYVLQAFESYMELHTSVRPPSETSSAASGDQTEDEFDDADEHMDLIEYPSEGSLIEIFFWIVLFPLRFLMHFTVPDVRQLDRHGELTSTIGQAYFATFMCLVWLVVGSYAMVASLESLAELMDIPDAVIGVTVSAAGTSLPNYVASKVAAENGFGNQAVSNAFGSNTFNIMVGLGLPWVLYTSFGTGFEPYNGLRDEGILESIIILFAVLLVFVVLMLSTGFVIQKWHGYLFIVLYIAYLALAIGQVYL